MNMKRASILISALIVSWPAFALAGDEPSRDGGADAGQPDAMEILRQADEACKAVNAVSYKAEFFGEGNLADQLTRITGTVKAGERRQSLLGRLLGKCSESYRIRIEGKATKPGSREEWCFTVASDGKRVYRISMNNKEFISGSLPKAKSLLAKSGRPPLFMLEYLHDTPFSDELNGKSARYEGTRDVGGVECHVIYVVYANDMESRWYFGTEDSLPRRVDRIVSEGSSMGSFTLEVSNLDTKPELSPCDFCLECPKGFDSKECEPWRRKAKVPQKKKPSN